MKSILFKSSFFLTSDKQKTTGKLLQEHHTLKKKQNFDELAKFHIKDSHKLFFMKTLHHSI